MKRMLQSTVTTVSTATIPTTRNLVAAALIFSIGLGFCGGEKKEASDAGYYTCSMHPQVISPKPGTCPICNMKLTWVESSGKAGSEGESHDGHGHEGDETDHPDDNDNGNDKGNAGSAATGSMNDPKSGGATGKAGAGNNGGPSSDAQAKGFRFQLSRTIIRNANIATVPVTKEGFLAEKKFSAHIDFNEEPNRLVIVSPKYDGWVEKLFVSKEGQFVNQGQALLGIYSPGILAAKEEYVTTYKTIKELYLVQNKPAEDVLKDPTVQASRQKLVLLDVPEHQIKKIEESGKAGRRVFYASPISGVVTKKDVLQGAHIKQGQEIMRIANLYSLWAFFHVFEKDLALVKKGQTVEIHTQSYTDKVYKGTVDLVYPFVNPETKDVKVRVVIANPKLELKPGMFAEVHLNAKLAKNATVIPDNSVIFSGDKNYVFVSLGGGRFEVRAVKVRATSNGRALVSSGLDENEFIVTNGQFLLDSEASLKEALAKGNTEGHNH